MIVFTSLDPRLARSTFDCGNPAVTNWFRHQAGQQDRRDGARTTVGLATFDSAIASFFTLITHRLELDDAAASTFYASRRYPIPAVLIAQLGVDIRYQRKGIGALTLGHALQVLSETSKAIGFEVVLVDAIDERAGAFYERYGFRPLAEGSSRLFLPTRTLRNAVAANQE